MQQQMNSGDINLDPRFDPLATLDNAGAENRWANDKKLFIQFHTKPVMNPFKSSQAGRAIYDEVDYIVLRTPGSQLTVIESKVQGTKYAKRFAAQYKAWREGQTELLSGSPLETFPLLLGKVGLVAELKALNVQTVEQLADLSDGYISQVMGGMEIRARAKEWIESTKGPSAQLSQLAAENDQLRRRLEALERVAAGAAPSPAPAASAPAAVASPAPAAPKPVKKE